MAAIDVKEDAALVQMTLGMKGQGKVAALTQSWHVAKAAVEQMAGADIQLQMDTELAVVRVKGDSAALQEFMLLMRGQISPAMQPYLWIGMEKVTLLQLEMEQDAAELGQFQRVDREAAVRSMTSRAEKQQDGTAAPTVKSAGSSQLVGEAIELDMPESRVIGSPIEAAQIGVLSASELFGFMLEQQEKQTEQQSVIGEISAAPSQKQITILTDVTAQQNIVAIEALLRVQVEPVVPVMSIELITELPTEPEIVAVEPEPVPETEEPVIPPAPPTGGGGGGSSTPPDPYTELSLTWDMPSPEDTSFSSLQLWLDSNDLSTVTLNGNQVTGLADKGTSVATNNAAAVAQTNAPVYGFSSSFGLKTLQLDGVNDYLRVLDADNLDNTNGLTIFAMVTPTNIAANANAIISKRIDTNNNDSYSLFLRSTQKLAIDIHGNNDRFYNATDFNDNIAALIAIKYDGMEIAANRSELIIDGRSDAIFYESSSSIPNNSADLFIGRIGGFFGGTISAFHGDIHEVMVFTSALSDADRQAIERYMAVKYGHTIDASVPSTDVPTITGSSTALNRLELTGGALQISLKDDAPITAVEYLDLRGNHASHAIAVRDSYFDTIHQNTVILDATGNTKGVIFSGTLVTDSSNVLDLRGSGVVDVLAGGAGNDKLTGNGGADSLTGGIGNDIFIYSATADSGIGSGNRDIITDFSTGADVINLSALYAGGSLTFQNGGTGEMNFSGTSPQLAYQQVSSNTIIHIDTNGDGITNLEIELTGTHTLTTTDFIL